MQLFTRKDELAQYRLGMKKRLRRAGFVVDAETSTVMLESMIEELNRGENLHKHNKEFEIDERRFFCDICQKWIGGD